VLVLLAFGSPGNDQGTSELSWLQAETEPAMLIAESGLPSSTGTGRPQPAVCQLGELSAQAGVGFAQRPQRTAGLP
jgi:hypothetical protein